MFKNLKISAIEEGERSTSHSEQKEGQRERGNNILFNNL